MKAAILFLAMLTATASMGCSTHYKSTDPQVSEEEMQSWLGEATSNVQSLSANRLAQDPSTLIYFADSQIGTMGNVVSILAFDNLNFIDPSVWIDSVGNARVFFLDRNLGDGAHENTLIVGLSTGSGFQYYPFDGRNSSVSGGTQYETGVFETTITGGDGLEYKLRSYDVQGDDLASDIQLKVFGSDADGNEVYVGKFSILAGFQ